MIDKFTQLPSQPAKREVSYFRSPFLSHQSEANPAFVINGDVRDVFKQCLETIEKIDPEIYKNLLGMSENKRIKFALVDKVFSSIGLSSEEKKSVCIPKWGVAEGNSCTVKKDVFNQEKSVLEKYYEVNFDKSLITKNKSLGRILVSLYKELITINQIEKGASSSSSQIIGIVKNKMIQFCQRLPSNQIDGLSDQIKVALKEDDDAQKFDK